MAADRRSPVARRLIRAPSVTPEDEGAIPHLADALEALGFACETMEFAEPGTEPILNLYARLGTRRPQFLLRRPYRRGAAGRRGALERRSVRGAVREAACSMAAAPPT